MIFYKDAISAITKCSKFLTTILEANDRLVLFMIYFGIAMDDLLVTNDLFNEPLPLLFVTNMILQQTVVSTSVDLSNIVLFAYLGDMSIPDMMENSTSSWPLFESPIPWLFYFASAILESKDNMIPPLSFS